MFRNPVEILKNERPDLINYILNKMPVEALELYKKGFLWTGLPPYHLAYELNQLNQDMHNKEKYPIQGENFSTYFNSMQKFIIIKVDRKLS